MTLASIPQIAWPDPASCRYVYRGSGRDKLRYMHTPDGVFPGVTTILKIAGMKTEALQRWSGEMERFAVLEAAELAFKTSRARDATSFRVDVETQLGPARAAQKTMDAAADIGTAVHEAIKGRIRVELGHPLGEAFVATLPDEAQWAFMAWQDWWTKSGLVPVVAEQPLWSRDFGFGGTVDLIAFNPSTSKFVVADWKSSKGTYDDYHLQVAAYVNLVEQYVPVENALIVRLPKNLADTEFKVRELGERELYDHASRTVKLKRQSREEMLVAFMGFKSAFDVLWHRDS